MAANGIVQVVTGTGGVVPSLALQALEGFPAFDKKYVSGDAGDYFTFGVKNKATGVFAFIAQGHLSDSTTLVIDRYVDTWDGLAKDETSPAAIALAAGVDYLVYPVFEAGGVARAWPTAHGDLTRATDSRRFLFGEAIGTVTTFTMVANTLYLWPVRWPTADTLKKLFADVSTGITGSSLRLGVWSMKYDSTPGRLLCETDALSSAVANMVGGTAKLSGSAVEVRPPAQGVWVGILSDQAIAVRCAPMVAFGGLGWHATTARYHNAHATLARAFTDGLPSTISAFTSVVNSGSSGQTPMLWGGV